MGSLGYSSVRQATSLGNLQGGELAARRAQSPKLILARSETSNNHFHQGVLMSFNDLPGLQCHTAEFITRACLFESSPTACARRCSTVKTFFCNWQRSHVER